MGEPGGDRLSHFPASVPGPTSWCQPRPLPKGRRPANPQHRGVSPLRPAVRSDQAGAPGGAGQRRVRAPARPGPIGRVRVPTSPRQPGPGSASLPRAQTVPQAIRGLDWVVPGSLRPQPSLQRAWTEPGAQPCLPGPPCPRREGQAPRARPVLSKTPRTLRSGGGGQVLGGGGARPSREEGAVPPEGGQFSEDLASPHRTPQHGNSLGAWAPERGHVPRETGLRKPGTDGHPFYLNI